MSYKLTELLIEKNLLKPDMEIAAVYQTYDVSGINKVIITDDFFIKSIKQISLNGVQRYYLDICSVKDGRNMKILSGNIRQIEGMSVKRFAKVYNINPNGSIVKEGKKRGRKTNEELKRLKELKNEASECHI